MADETKTEGGFGATVKKAVKIIVGILVVLVGLGLLWWWWPQFAVVFKGLLGLFLVLVGLIIVAIGWTD